MFPDDIEELEDYDDIFNDTENLGNTEDLKDISKSSVKIENKNKKLFEKEKEKNISSMEIIIGLLLIIIIAGSLSLYSHWYIFIK